MTTDGTAKDKDASVAVQDPSDAKQGTSQDAATTSGKSIQDQISDALAKAGRDAKSLKEKQDALDKREAELNERQTKEREAQRQRELEGAEGEEKTLLERKYALDDREKALNDREASINRDDEDYNKYKETIRLGFYMISASNHGIDATDLKEAAERLKLTTDEQIESLAESMGKVKSGEPHVDSGRMSGSGDNTAKTPDAKISRGLSKIKKK